jgi:hypothetical protein
VVNGATVKLGGALAGSVEASGNRFSLGAAGSRKNWNAKFGIQGDSPMTLTGTLTGPGPVINATVMAFGIPVSVNGTPGKDLSISLGLSPRSSILDDARTVAVVKGPPLAAETPQQVFTRVSLEWLRRVVGFTIVGWLLLLVAPGLKGRAHAAINSLPFSRLGVGAILALDIPLASLVAIAIGLPLGLWWLGFLGLLVFLAVAVAGFSYTGFQLGRLTFDRLGWARVNSFASVPVGVGALGLAGLIPYAGPFISLLATVYGIGSMLYSPRRQVGAGAAAEAIVPAKSERPAPAGRPAVE